MSDTLLRNANALLGHGRQREALVYYERYLDAHPQSPEAWFNRGAALAQLKRYEHALDCYGRALALRPDSAQVWNARGNLHFETGRYAEAKTNYENALARDFDFPYARGYLLLLKLWICDWQGLEAERAEIRTGLAQGKRVIPPFGSLMVCEDPADLARAARIWTLGARSAAAPLWQGESYRHDRLRIAYLSGDFHDHPVAQLMAGVFEAHDRARFEIFGISFGPDDAGAMRRRLRDGFDHFVDARSMNDAAVAQFLRQNEIDVAVDLMGLTADCRSGILQHRPAPVQVNYLGFPGTMALPTMDYILADRVVLPEPEQSFYTEKAVYLPGSYMANDRHRSIASNPPDRAALGLPEGGFVFASFNNT